MTKWFDCPVGISNFTGYIAGLVNSFIWNRLWTFKYSGAWIASALRFLIVFGFCYIVQFAVVSYLNSGILSWHVHLSTFEVADDHLNFIAGMIVYNVMFFLLSKFVTFREQKA
jgi:putative flippase GtrA